MFWLVFLLIASARSHPVTTDVLQEAPQVEGAPGGALKHDNDLQDLGADPSQMFSHVKTLANTLQHVFRHGRGLEVLVGDGTGRQTAATLASSLGDLIRPAITAFVGALSMNSATSLTNAITALLGGRSLDLIPAAAFMTAPATRESPVLQPTRETPEEVLKRRPSRRKTRYPASVTYGRSL